ncbi:MAG: hypothetical protein KKA73_07100 [Chloroflexi bacterium]|nr:hypothetical protein [Chloroflexota bacterium]MBU1747437.1 hypothetical protein [Chloroflexota bacterium]
MRYIVRITDSGPLSFRTGRDTTGASTLSYVPGSALLGGLAAAHIRLRHDADQFNRFFMSPWASFGNLYPSSFAHDDLVDNTNPVYPLPRTACSCKRFGGFTYDEDDPKDAPHHGVFDTLIPWTLFALSGQTQSDVLVPSMDCPICQASMDRFGGFYRRNAYDERVMGISGVNRGLRTRTGIDRATGTVKQGILYSREVLRPGMTFWGTLSVTDDEAQAFNQFIQDANVSHLLRLGNNNTRGFGRVTLALETPDQLDSEQALQTRILTFDSELRRRALNAHITVPHSLYLPLTLTSDAILFDQVLRHQAIIEPRYLAETWGIAGAELVYQNSGLRRVMGWSDLWRTPKPDDFAITMGSVFLFGLSTPLDDNLVQALLTMQTEGIGARGREGFGRLLVASPFHWEVKGQ